MNDLNVLRSNIRANELASEQLVLDSLMQSEELSTDLRASIVTRATQLVEDIRAAEKPGLMEAFLAEYGLSTDEGVALMCLAEALLRVPDADTMDALIEDKIAPSSWGQHLGQSSSSLVNASTWALMITGKILKEDEQQGIASTLMGAIKRLGEPLIRTAVKQAMKELGSEFVLGQTIDEAVQRGQKQQAKGYTYSYDMLGEAALTAKDATKFFNAYESSISALAKQCESTDVRENPGISIKLSALHPRYEVSQRERVMTELVDSTKQLARQSKAAGMGFNIDAEEADRLDLSLDVIEAVLSDPGLAGWDGFGVVVQAYGKRCPEVIEWLYQLATSLDRRIMVRLVKGAYWDTEIKLAQTEGLDGFPVYTQKAATDVAYVCCAKKLLGLTDRIYPQFATHNAHTVAAVLEMADDKEAFEFQRLHGMGESLHETVLQKNQTRCRIYAPVGAHRDLLAYLVRRLLENGANSSFVNQIVDTNIEAADVVADPFNKVSFDEKTGVISKPIDLYQPARDNSRGWDLRSIEDLEAIEAARTPFIDKQWQAKPLVVNDAELANTGALQTVSNPANPAEKVGEVMDADGAVVANAIQSATPWEQSALQRADILQKAADLYEQNFGELFAVLTREAGKTPMDAIAELREAVDFLRFYAVESKQSKNVEGKQARGLITCISPWNFPLAIFTGQIAAALAAGNAVLAKPAEQAPITAYLAVRLLHEAGVPVTALQLLPGKGAIVGAMLSADPRIKGVCFTGSTVTAQHINRSMAKHLDPEAVLIAETGGLNAMIVDSTALPEQAVKDIVNSAFQSAGQRCSALRVLYVQEDTADIILNMLYGAMDELVLGAPWDFATDIGPVIDKTAHQQILAYIDEAQAQGRVLKSLEAPEAGYFVPPTVIKVNGIADLAREVFGPVLHVATFKADGLSRVLEDINASGYGLTFGLHTRIDDRVESITRGLNVGNMYINRNQIGAVVGSQPFGGEGMSGTGPKAGGPNYLPRFMTTESVAAEVIDRTEAAYTLSKEDVQAAIDGLAPASQTALQSALLPGPTGESNQWSCYARGTVLCLGPSAEEALAQASVAKSVGCAVLAIAPDLSASAQDKTGITCLDGSFDLAYLADLSSIDVVAFSGKQQARRTAREALASRDGAIIPLVCEDDLAARCILERHVCIDTTAAGGNASLLAATDA
ncbi:bifunctional proline dehydrogenase/L-glutamate gamma-semialdehyde dehydrogenase PutA [Leucothrix sargassi]|nr:bifunctional proline dehydrogenase/L-glutamate gamma-semialdehyde dehydrogenase PutA [Leucothrix sargassi]